MDTVDAPDHAASDLLVVLERAELHWEGRLTSASNAVLVAGAGEPGIRCVVKPIAGERPLWDFPDGSLAGREVAAYSLSEHLGWGIIPPTVYRAETDFGAAMVQGWIDADPYLDLVDVRPPEAVPDTWCRVLEGEDSQGRPLTLAHANLPELARIAVFDSLVNNADRKGGHILPDASGRLWAIDHGVCFASEPKLRTVLWGWAGEPIDMALLDDVAALHESLRQDVDDIDRWLTHEERVALRDRTRALLHEGTFPMPSPDWPALPWPPL